MGSPGDGFTHIHLNNSGRGLLVYEGEFSPDFPLGGVEPFHFAPPPGEVALGSLTPRRARGKEPFETSA